jgi:hypothetical protein
MKRSEIELKSLKESETRLKEDLKRAKSMEDKTVYNPVTGELHITVTSKQGNTRRTSVNLLSDG